jgi:hypothetical protein
VQPHEASSNRNLSADIDFGPLAGLVGTWRGDKGVDISPEPDGTEENHYYETLAVEAVGDITNAESQTLAVVRYVQTVNRKSDDKVIHNETGYWMWDAESQSLMHSLIIPRGVCVLAKGEAARTNGTVDLKATAKLDDSQWGILQSPFMQEKASTTEYRRTITLDGDTLQYSQSMMLDIYGRTFEHTDENVLTRG